MMAKKPIQDGAGRGIRKAASYYPERVAEALKEFRHLNTREARAAFADHWIGLWAREFDDAWPMLYELLEIVKEDELYRDPRRVGPAAAGGPETHGDTSEYPDFRAYFEDRVSQPFETWAELEGTYRFVHEYRPEFFARGFEVARRAAALDGMTVNAGSGRLTENEISNRDVITVRDHGKGGTSADYLTRRIARDHPEIFRRMQDGEFRSARAAALEAGIVPRTQTVRIDDPASVARTLRRYMTPAQLAELSQLLTEET